MIYQEAIGEKEFKLISDGLKTFTTEFGDYCIGDYIAFNEHNKTTYTGKTCLFKIVYTEPEDNKGFIKIGFRPCFIAPKDNDLNMPKQHFLYSAPVYDREVSTDAK